MQIELSTDIAKRIEKVCKEIGINKKKLVDRAILLYLDNLGKYLELKQELKEWDTLSDEALANFEKSL